MKKTVTLSFIMIQIVFFILSINLVESSEQEGKGATDSNLLSDSINSDLSSSFT